MTHYDVRLYTDKGVYGSTTRGVECKPTEIPEMLACVVMGYLKNSPYRGSMRARSIAGRHYTEYVLMLENDTLDVYRHVGRAARVDVRENPTGPAPPRDRGDAA